MAATAIEPEFVKRVWGTFELQPWYGNRSEKIGEVWFPAGDLLIKFLFTTDKLSVQVHPDDDYARRHHNGSNGKTEMWHVLSAGPDARIAAGFSGPVSADAARAAAVDGSIEQLLTWHPAHAGDTFFVPAGMVHALGADLVVCEIQQMSDITYRLYDYLRQPPRELHLERGFDVADMIPHPGPAAPEPIAPGGVRLAACPYFVTERWELTAPRQFPDPAEMVLIGLSGGATIGESGRLTPGTVWRVDAGETVRPDAGGAVVLRTYVPATGQQRAVRN